MFSSVTVSADSDTVTPGVAGVVPPLTVPLMATLSDLLLEVVPHTPEAFLKL